MFEYIDNPKRIEEKMKEFRETNCSGVSADEFGKFARRVASIIPRGGGMRKGIIHPLGELWACVRFGLKLMPEGNEGYDAADPEGKRYQIKSRHPETSRYVNLMGTTPRFSSFEFDKALLVLMDEDLQNYETWLADANSIKRHLRPKRADLHIRKFQAIGRRIYP